MLSHEQRDVQGRYHPLRSIRHQVARRILEQHRWLHRVLNGHYQYFGVIFNYRSPRVFKVCGVKDWRKVLGKRSQKGCMNWANYRQILIAFPLPEPVIHQAWRQ
jgi:RNA-directed DNA polymerase